MYRSSILVLLALSLMLLSPNISSGEFEEEMFGVVKTETDPETGVTFNLKKDYVRKYIGSRDRSKRYTYTEIDPCTKRQTARDQAIIILVNVPKEINLSDHNTAKVVLEKSRKYVFKKCARKVIGIDCPRRGDRVPKGVLCTDLINMDSKIYLYNSEFNGENWGKIWKVTARISKYPDETRLFKYHNKAFEEAKAKLVAEEKEHAAEEKRRQSTIREARLAEERRKADEQARIRQETRRYEAERHQKEIENQKAVARDKFEVFSRKNGIQHWPRSDEFQANPFIYEGENIGMKTKFMEMISANKGIFQDSSSSFIIVSKIPRGMFLKVSDLVLSGRFIGKESIKLPILGDVSIPHLEFIDAYICKNYPCDEMLFWMK